MGYSAYGLGHAVHVCHLWGEDTLNHSVWQKAKEKLPDLLHLLFVGKVLIHFLALSIIELLVDAWSKCLKVLKAE